MEQVIIKAPIIPYNLRKGTSPTRRYVPGNAEYVDEEAVGSNLTIAVPLYSIYSPGSEATKQYPTGIYPVSHDQSS